MSIVKTSSITSGRQQSDCAAEISPPYRSSKNGQVFASVFEKPGRATHLAFLMRITVVAGNPGGRRRFLVVVRIAVMRHLPLRNPGSE